MGVREKKYPEILSEVKLEETKNLVLYNDDVNTFEYVIISLVEVCGHNELQAENCALITHLKGKCSVKSGTFDELKPHYDELLRRKLTVKII